MSDKRYRVRWHGVNCSGCFNRTFEDKEDAEMFAKAWLLDCVLGGDVFGEGVDLGDSYTYEVIGFFPIPAGDVKDLDRVPIWDLWD
jgi:hypothetical protein